MEAATCILDKRSNKSSSNNILNFIYKSNPKYHCFRFFNPKYMILKKETAILLLILIFMGKL